VEEDKNNIKYVINWDSREIQKEEIISKEFIKYLKEKEVHKFIKQNNLQLGIVSERDVIHWLPEDENQNYWDTKIRNHICEKIIKDEDDYFVGCEYDDFKGSYFFVASLWKTTIGGDLIILEHYH